MADSAPGVALITGAGRGIGHGCALALAESGYRVIGVARTAEDLQSLEAHPSGAIEGWQADVTDASLAARIATIENLTAVVNNAGGNRPQPFVDVDRESLDAILDLNVRAAFLVAQASARAMKKHGRGGSIVNMSSQMGHVGSPNRSVYCMTKHAIEGLTKATAVELAAEGIRVNTVAPTFVDTPLTRPMLDDPDTKAWIMDMLPGRQLATVADVVAAVMYLLRPESRMVTGHSLRVDGGWTAR